MTLLAIAGIAGPLIFTLLVIVQGLLQPDYKHVALPISALAVWPYGWIQNLNFYVAGFLMILNALGLHAGVRPVRSGVLGAAILTLSGIGLVLAGTFPMIREGSAIVEPPGHSMAAILTFLSAGIGLGVMSRRMARDPVWRGVARYALVCGVTIVVLFAVMAGFAVPDDGPLHPWFGLLQRVVLVVWFPCLIVLAIRLLRIARGSSL